MPRNSLEDNALKAILGASDLQIAQLHENLEDLEGALATIGRTVATLKSILATFNANQKRYRNG